MSLPDHDCRGTEIQVKRKGLGATRKDPSGAGIIKLTRSYVEREETGISSKDDTVRGGEKTGDRIGKTERHSGKFSCTKKRTTSF